MKDVKIPCSTMEYLALTEKQKLQLLKQASNQPPVRCGQHSDTDPLFRCTVCGQIGTVGRCCGLETREPMNELAHLEIEDRNEKSESRAGIQPFERDADREGARP